MATSSPHDRGVVTPVEMMFLLVMMLVALAFFGYVGRLHAAGIQISNTAQSAARAASQASDGITAAAVAQAVVDQSPLAQRCTPAPVATTTWAPSELGTWQGGAVTVSVRCDVSNAGLAGLWTPGRRTVVVRDTQPIDRYQR